MSHDSDAIDGGTALDVVPEVSHEDEDRPGSERIDGAWVEKGMSNTAALVGSNWNVVLKLHARANRLGFVFSGSAQCQLFAATAERVRRPDISFVRSGRLPNDRVPVGKMQLARMRRTT